MTDKISIEQKFGLFEERWRPKIIARLNDHEVKLIKVEGEFPWHSHANEDEFFLVWKGTFRVEFRDRIVELGPGECLVVPKGVEHRTCASAEAHVVCVEPRGVVNTGNVADPEFTAPGGVAI